MALIKCPECGKKISDQASACPNCGVSLNSVQMRALLNKQQPKKYTSWFALIGLVLFLIIGAKVCNTEEAYDFTSKERARLEAVLCVEQYLKGNLKDPKSYESVDWGKVDMRDDGGYTIRHTYRAKNSFGGYTVENKVFLISPTGRIENVVDYSE